MTSNDIFLISLLVATLFFIILVVYFIIAVIKSKLSLKRTTQQILFSVSLPKDQDPNDQQQERKDDKEIISVMEQFLSSLHKIKDAGISGSFLGAPEITFEIANPYNDEGIYFFIAAPKKYATAIEKQIYGFFPKADVRRKRGDYNMFVPKGQTAGTNLSLKKAPFMSLRTYKMMETDPLNNITNALSKLDRTKEGAAIQIIIKPIPINWRVKGMTVARRMKQGESFRKAKAGGLSRFFRDFIKTLTGSSVAEKQRMNEYGMYQDEVRQLTPGEEELLKAIEEKTNKPAFRINIRLITSADTKERARELLEHLKVAFYQFDTNEMNGLNYRSPGPIREFVFNYSFRKYLTKNSFILSTEEISSIFHFPIYSTQTPKLEQLKAKMASPPPNLPDTGLLIGKNTYRETETPIYLQQNDRRRHLYTIGQTGTGKSTFMENLIIQDIKNGEGVCVIDPHGELIENTLSHIPKSRIKDVIYFDPSDVDRPMGLNLLEFDRPEQKTFVINEMINIFDKLYDLRQTGGPMFENYMRNAMLLVMSHPESGSTLMEISKVLADEDYRRMKLDNCDNQMVIDFWVKEAEKAGGEAALANMVPYITSKLTSFVTNDIMRPIIAQQKTAFNIREAMDSKKILMINLSKGKIGELNANLIGMVLVGKILMSAMSRVDIPEEQRNDFYLYIDEFQNVTTDSIASILSEARKYKLNLTIGHQFIQQLEEKIRDAVFGNVGSMVTFRIGATDAEFVVKQYAPTFSERDLINVDNYNAFVKVMINNVVSNPFSLATYPPVDIEVDYKKQIIQFSRLKYGRDREVVEKELKERLKLADRPGGFDSGFGSPVDSDMPVK